MADNVVLPGTGSSVATDEIGGNQFQRMKLTLGADGVNDGDVSSTNPIPVIGGLTDAELRAASVPVSDAMVAELIEGLQTLLVRLLNATNSPRGYDVALGRNRVTALIESGTITTVSTVSNQINIGGQQAQLLTNGQNASAWAATVRSRIT